MNEIDSRIIEKIELGKIKDFKVFSAVQLLALLHILKTTIFETNILFIFHGLTALLINEKVFIFLKIIYFLSHSVFSLPVCLFICLFDGFIDL